MDGSSNVGLIGGDRLSDGRVVVNVLRHHLEHGRKRDQRNKCRVKSLCLSAIGERSAGETLVVYKPVVDVENLLGIGGGRRDLGEERVRIERDGSQQLVELLRSRRWRGWSCLSGGSGRRLSLETWNTTQNKKTEKQK